MKYTINYDNIKLRQEENGTYSFMNSTTGKIAFLNKVASYIYLHNEINTLDLLVENIMEHFDAPSVEKVKADCINALHIMSSLELLTIENDVNETVEEGCFIAGEGDYKKISDFILDNFKNKKKVLFYSSNNLYYYSHYSIRARQFNNKEYNFIYYSDKKEILAHISLGVITNSTFALMNVFADKSNFDKVKKLLSYAFEITPSLNKIKISIKSDNSNNEMRENAENLGFELETVMKDEISKGIDLLNYSLLRG